jgi:mRNA-degrading endonuclease RelE of RelBE toxin-antitoxin system
MDVVITPVAAAQIDALPKPIRARVYKIVERLRQWPDVSGAKPLSGDLAGHYRMRTGDYRIQFQILRGTVVVERVGHRDGFYDD